MDSRCYRCASKFGLFKKEIACSKCGHGFCKKCLPHVLKLSTSTDAVPVCAACFKTIDDKVPKPAAHGTKYDDVPENFKKRVAALKDKEESPRAPASQPTKSSAPEPGSQRDMEQRLGKLKEDKRKEAGPAASYEEMEERLRALRGLPAKKQDGHSSQVHHPPDTRTSHEQTKDLMTEMNEEIKLDGEVAGSSSAKNEPHEDSDEVDLSSITPQDETKQLEDEVKNVMDEARQELRAAEVSNKQASEMEERLARLKGMDVETFRDNGRNELEGMSEEESRKRYITMLLEESRLDDQMKKDGYGQVLEESAAGYKDETKNTDPDELPWCCICNEDAIVRCHDCDEDLYCKKCFRDGHDEFDMKYHKTSKYRAPKDSGR